MLQKYFDFNAFVGIFFFLVESEEPKFFPFVCNQKYWSVTEIECSSETPVTHQPKVFRKKLSSVMTEKNQKASIFHPNFPLHKKFC